MQGGLRTLRLTTVILWPHAGTLPIQSTCNLLAEIPDDYVIKGNLRVQFNFRYRQSGCEIDTEGSVQSVYQVQKHQLILTSSCSYAYLLAGASIVLILRLLS